MNKVILLLALLFIFGCGTKEDESPVKSESQLFADSLKAATDSLRDARRLHSLQPGGHIHAPGSNLAEAAHQDLPGKRRMRAYNNKHREARKSAAAAHAKRVAATLDSLNAKK